MDLGQGLVILVRWQGLPARALLARFRRLVHVDGQVTRLIHGSNDRGAVGSELIFQEVLVTVGRFWSSSLGLAGLQGSRLGLADDGDPILAGRNPVTFRTGHLVGRLAFVVDFAAVADQAPEADAAVTKANVDPARVQAAGLSAAIVQPVSLAFVVTLCRG